MKEEQPRALQYLARLCGGSPLKNETGVDKENEMWSRVFEKTPRVDLYCLLHIYRWGKNEKKVLL